MDKKGLDCGTAFFVCADEDGIRLQRNAFITLDSSTTSTKQLQLMKVPYVIINNQISIVGTKAVELANIFNNAELRRPMRSGVLNPTERDAYPVLQLIIKNILGEKKDKEGIVVYSVPAKPIDVVQEIDYHSDVLRTLIENSGYTAKPINEAAALAYVGLSDDELTGISISFGAGMANVAIMYQGISALNFAVSRSGDYIDSMVANDCGITKAKAQYIKEAANYSLNPNKIDIKTREQQAIKTYYSVLIRYILSNIEKQFLSTNMPTFPKPIKIVCGGGTSMVPGFIELFKSEFEQKQFPIDIEDIVLVKEPLTAVARGCLIAAELEEN